MQPERSAFRVVHVSDTHLTAPSNPRHRRSAALCRRNWAVVANEIRRLAPDLVVHGGDILFEDPDDSAGRAFARSALNALGRPWRAVPGNHDLGDGPPDPVFGQAISAERCRRHAEAFDATPWAERHDGWLLIGANSQLMGTGWTAEAEQWARLEETLSGAEATAVALFLHKPPYFQDFDEPDVSASILMPAARARLSALVARYPIRLIACGHRHEYRVSLWQGCAVVVAPSTAFTLPEGTPPFAQDTGFPGFVEYAFGRGGALRWRVVAPDGLVRLDAGFFGDHGAGDAALG